MSETTEPFLIASMRKKPTGDIRHNPKGGGALGTSAAGFIREFDDCIAERFEAGVRQAIEWLRADYAYGEGPEWRENGCEWIADRLAEHTRSRVMPTAPPATNTPARRGSEGESSSERDTSEFAVAAKVTQVLRDRGWLDSGDAADAGPEVAAHLADLLAARDRRVRAEALREAADNREPEFHIEVALGSSDYVRHWLRDRADRIEAEA